MIFQDVWDMMNIYVLSGVGLVLLVGVFVILFRMQKIRQESRSALSGRYSKEDIVYHDNLAHCLGSDQSGELQGKGVLVLSGHELYFFRLHPRLEFVIPLRRIKKVVNPTVFGTITSPSPLLEVSYREDSSSRVHSVAWKLRDVSSFTESLKAQRKKIQVKKRKQ